jgi:hypothetical protein
MVRCQQQFITALLQINLKSFKDERNNNKEFQKNNQPVISIDTKKKEPRFLSLIWIICKLQNCRPTPYTCTVLRKLYTCTI